MKFYLYDILKKTKTQQREQLCGFQVMGRRKE
jgi:hypothetical protein